LTSAGVEGAHRDLLLSSWTLLDAVPEAVILMDDTGHILKANLAAESMFDWAAEDLTGVPIDLLLCADTSNREVGFSTVLPSVQNSTVEQHLFQTVGLKNNGVEFPCEVSLKTTDDRQERSRWLITVRDTTERDFHESRIRETVRMDAVADVAARVANDFNNQLAAISGNLEALRAALERGSSSVGPEIEAACDATDNAARVMRRLSSVAGQSTSVRRVTDPRHLVERALEVIEPNVPGNTTIRHSFNHDGWLVSADGEQFVDILVNCCHNAVEAMESGGVLSIATRRVASSNSRTTGSENGPAGEFVRIDVADTGRGIPPADLPRIFEPFFTTKSSRGAGMGLAAVYNALKAHQGGITVESTVGEGTTFHIFLPHTVVDPLAIPSHVDAVTPTTARTILVIDDEPAIRQLTKKALEARGYVVLVAGDAGTGLEMYHKHSDDIGVVITDVVMPDMSGWEVLAKLKQKDSSLPVIVVSGYPGAREPDKDTPPPDILLRKPYQLTDLLEAIDETQEKQRRRR
jgi:two-component system, cell cycle sensor histidine kinase and response regulator CckA